MLMMPDGVTFSHYSTETAIMAEKTRDYREGYDIGRKAKLGDALPHPSNRLHPENFYHGMRAALGGRGLDISLFLQVIERKTNASH